MTWVSFLIGVFVGACVGLAAAAMCKISKSED